MKRRIGIQGIFIFIAVVVTVVLSKLVFPHWREEPLDEFFDAVGVALILFGFLFRIAARGYKEEKSEAGKVLVKDGPYYLMRHPMYFGTFLIGTGIILVLFTLWMFPLFLIVYFSIYGPQIKKEDNVLSARFGEEYRQYVKATPKYFPKIHGLLNIRHYVSLRLSWVRKEFPSLIAVVIIILGIETWEDLRLFGCGEFFKELWGLISITLAFVMLIVLFVKRQRQ